jgi:hypothetical protein
MQSAVLDRAAASDTDSRGSCLISMRLALAAGLGGCLMVGLVGCGGATSETAGLTPVLRPACLSPGARPVRDPAAAADPGLVQHLAILRRAQRASDLPVRLKRRLFSSLNLAFNLDRVAMRGIRNLGRAPSGVSFYLVPATVRVPGFACNPPHGPLKPALRQRLHELSEQALLRTQSFGLALAPVPPPGETSGAIYSAGALYADVSANRLIAIFNQPTNRSATLAGVVPDGVSAVRITYARVVRTVRIAAGTNFWATLMPTLVPGYVAEPYRFVWFGSNGQVRGRFDGISETPY